MWSFMLVLVALAQPPVAESRGTPRPESQVKGDRSVADAPLTQEQTKAAVERAIQGAATHLVVNSAAKSQFEISIMRGTDVVQALVFEDTAKGWKPVVPENLKGTLLDTGLSLGSVGGRAGRDGAVATADIEMLPFDPSIVNLPHNGVSMFVVDADLVLITLWNNFETVGVYYLLAADSPAATEDGDGGVAVVDPNVAAVCDKLLKTCLGELNTAWVQACDTWLHYCVAL